VPNYEDASNATVLLQLWLHWLKFGKSTVFIHVYQHLLWLNTGWTSQKILPCHIADQCQKHEMHQTPQNSWRQTFPDWCRNEFESSEMYLSMFTSFFMTEHWLKQKKCSPVEYQKWRCIHHHKTPADKPSLLSVGMSLDQIKYTYPCLTAFIMPEHWLWSSKTHYPATSLSNAKKIWCISHHKTLLDKPSLTCVGMSLVQIKYTYPCLLAFIMTEYRLKQPKSCPATLLLSAKQWRCINDHNIPTNKASLWLWCRNEFGLTKIYLSMFTSFYYDWTLAEAAKIMLFCLNVVECQTMEMHQPPQHSCKKKLTGVGMGLDYIKMLNHVCQLLLWLMNTGWSIHKYCPATLLLSAKLWRCLNDHSTPANKASLWLVEDEFGLSKIYLTGRSSHKSTQVQQQIWLTV